MTAPALPVPDAVVMTEGKRILFAIPWGERMILGTTDTDYDGSLDDVHADAEDIGYVLQIANQFFPAASWQRADVISTWAGLAAADRRSQRQALRHLALARDPQPRAGLVGRGGRQAHHLSADGRADGGPDSLAANATGAARSRGLPDGEEPLLPAAETQGVSGILPPAFSRARRRALLRQRMGRASGRCDAAPHELALLLQGRRAMAERAAEWMGELLGWSREVRRQN